MVRKVRNTAVRKPEPRSNQKMMGKGARGGGLRGDEEGSEKNSLSPPCHLPPSFSLLTSHGRINTNQKQNSHHKNASYAG